MAYAVEYPEETLVNHHKYEKAIDAIYGAAKVEDISKEEALVKVRDGEWDVYEVNETTGFKKEVSDSQIISELATDAGL